MGDWLQDRCNSIQKAQQEHIQKSFGTDIEKARAGVYKPTKQNLKTGKVGQKYGQEKKEDIINLGGKDRKVVSYNKFEQILNSVGMTWHGIKNWSRRDLDLFEEKFDGLTVEPIENGMKIWDRDFDYSNLK